MFFSFCYEIRKLRDISMNEGTNKIKRSWEGGNLATFKNLELNIKELPVIPLNYFFALKNETFI